jgi:hypothetical protein
MLPIIYYVINQQEAEIFDERAIFIHECQETKVAVVKTAGG